MKIKVRHGVFETNSSSMHSICILKNPGTLDYNENTELDYCDGIVKWYGYEKFYFDRYPFELLISPKDKIRYLFANMCPGIHNSKEERFCNTYDKILRAIQTKYPDVKEIKLPIRHNAETDKDFYYCGGDEDPSAYVELIIKRKLSLEEFIFNPKYFVVIDGDEYCNFANLIQIGAIDRNNVEEIIPPIE